MEKPIPQEVALRFFAWRAHSLRIPHHYKPGTERWEFLKKQRRYAGLTVDEQSQFGHAYNRAVFRQWQHNKKEMEDERAKIARAEELRRSQLKLDL